MQGKVSFLVNAYGCFFTLPRLLIGLTCLLVYSRGIYMVSSFLVNSVLAKVYFLVHSGECSIFCGSVLSFVV